MAMSRMLAQAPRAPLERCYGRDLGSMSATDHIERAAEEVLRCDHRPRVAALVYDVISRQSQGRTLFAGKRFVEARALEHGLSSAAAELPSGNILAMLERGPSTPRERSLVAAFAVSGLGDALGHAADPVSVLERFVEHAGWLEVATPYIVFPFVDALLAPGRAAMLWESVGDAILRDAAHSPSARARNVARLSALVASASPTAKSARARVVDEATDPVVAAMAAVFEGRDVAPEHLSAIEGRLGRAPTGGFRGFLRLLSGWALLQWLGRLLGFALGVRRDARVELGQEALEVHRRVRLLGRTVRESRDIHTFEAVAGAGRMARHPSVHLLVGALGLALGILLGGLYAFEGIRTGETVLLLAGAGLILGGAGLDLLLAVLVPAKAREVALDIRLLPRGTLRLTRVPEEDADRFLDALAARLEG